MHVASEYVGNDPAAAEAAKKAAAEREAADADKLASAGQQEASGRGPAWWRARAEGLLRRAREGARSSLKSELQKLERVRKQNLTSGGYLRP